MFKVVNIPQLFGCHEMTRNQPYNSSLFMLLQDLYYFQTTKRTPTINMSLFSYKFQLLFPGASTNMIVHFTVFFQDEKVKIMLVAVVFRQVFSTSHKSSTRESHKQLPKVMTD